MSQTPNAVHPHTTTKHHVNNAILTTPNSHCPPTEPTNTHQSKLQNKYKQSNKILTKYQQEHHSMSNNFLTKNIPNHPKNQPNPTTSNPHITPISPPPYAPFQPPSPHRNQPSITSETNITPLCLHMNPAPSQTIQNPS